MWKTEIDHTIIMCVDHSYLNGYAEKFHIPLQNASSFFHKTDLEGSSGTCLFAHQLQQQCSQTAHQATQLGALEKEI